jgi:hypothetical protein
MFLELEASMKAWHKFRRQRKIVKEKQPGPGAANGANSAD